MINDIQTYEITVHLTIRRNTYFSVLQRRNCFLESENCLKK